ncbi:hypothetical protein N665_0606s0005 [Sinapis alba]|nr:hypothetical protein N665_0606s0005 [Sinapis alba]
MPDEQKLQLLGMWMLLLHTNQTRKRTQLGLQLMSFPSRYSMREHALISRVDCHPISRLDCHEYTTKYENSGTSAFVDRHFNSHRDIRNKYVEDNLLNMSVCGDRLKMAVLYFLGTVIKGNRKFNGPFLIQPQKLGW